MPKYRDVVKVTFLAPALVCAALTGNPFVVAGACLAVNKVLDTKDDRD